MQYFLNDEKFKLINDDCFHALNEIDEKSVDFIFADPPYFLSSGGVSCHSGKQVIVDKGKWDCAISIEEKLAFHRKWICLCKKVLKDEGTIMISSTLHSVYAIGVALEMEGFSIINNIIWKKTNPAPNLSCRCFTHSTETIIWARKLIGNKKAKHFFNYDKMKEDNNGKQMKDYWIFECLEPETFECSTVNQSEKKNGNHPTQKPLKLMVRVLEAATKPGDLVLDPFNGSGTTGIASILHGRKYIGIEISKEFIELTKRRYDEICHERKTQLVEELTQM